MFFCKRCLKKFEKLKFVETTYENFYGVNDLFSYGTPLTLKVCPFCNSSNVEEIEENEEVEEE